MERIYQQHWIELPKELREKLAEVFNIPKTGICEVRDQTIISDGYTNTDLGAITLEAMKEYTDFEGEIKFSELWHKVLEKGVQELFGIEVMPAEPTIPLDGPKPYCSTCTSKAGRHKMGCPKFK
jgi:hypothetical protein